MKKTYKINSLFNEEGEYLTDLITSFFITLLDKELNYDNRTDI